MSTATATLPSRQAIDDLSQLFSLLSDKTRLRILALVMDGEMHVTAICEAVGMDQPAVSHHLALLRVSGVLVSRRVGKCNYYSVPLGGLGPFRKAIKSALAD